MKIWSQIALGLMLALPAFGQQSMPLSSLCDLQSELASGEHRAVRVEGVYLSGLESQDMISPACSKQSTAIEFDLKSRRLWKQLVQMSNKTTARKHAAGDGDPVLVLFEGEFYGPPVPDPKLPPAILKNYHPGWDYNSMTKLVVHAIQSVKPVSADQRTNAGCVLSTASNGQTVTVQGTVRQGPHDMGIDIPGCKDIVLLAYAGDQDTDASVAELRRDRELKRFQKYTQSVYKGTAKNICMACPKYEDVQAELTGKLQIATVPAGATKDRLGLVRDASGKFLGKSGWGHPMPFANYRLVIVSAANVKARKLPPPNLNP